MLQSRNIRIGGNYHLTNGLFNLFLINPSDPVGHGFLVSVIEIGKAIEDRLFSTEIAAGEPNLFSAEAHAQGAVQSNKLAIQVRVLDDMAGQGGEFRGFAQAGREGDLLSQALLDLFV